MDLIATVARMPRPGETVFGTYLQQIPGGKGLNQAVAARRLGHEPVEMIGKVGDDDFGDSLLEFIRSQDIDLVGVSRCPGPTGTALITVDADAENTIVVVPGANSRLRPEDLDRQTYLIAEAGTALAQLEIPVETVQGFFSMAKEAGATTVLNTAPARVLPDKLLTLVDYLCLNETELAEMAVLEGVPEKQEEIVSGARSLLARGPGCVIVTLGARGAITVTCGAVLITGGLKVDAIDPTGAGDCFLGALAARLNGGVPLAEALAFANRAAGISVQRAGASSSIPYRWEVEGRDPD